MPSRTGPAVPAGPADVDPDRYVELIAQSLREACRCQGEAAFPLIARVIDQHIAGGLQRRRIGRWRNEAMDSLLSLISPAMQAQIREHRES